MYKISELTGKIYLNGVEIPLDENNQEYQQYLLDKDLLGVEFVEYTTDEILNKNIKQAIQIDLEYTERISKLMSKHNDKFIEGLIIGIQYKIPQDVIEEKERLKSECNRLIKYLGINDFSYRQENLQLKK